MTLNDVWWQDSSNTILYLNLKMEYKWTKLNVNNALKKKLSPTSILRAAIKSF